jgi:hypothetical protein
MNFYEAQSHCSSLGSAPMSPYNSGWRRPTVGELRTLLHGCPATEGNCNVDDNDCLSYSCMGSCSGCQNWFPYWPDEMEGECCWYWSSSWVEDYADLAWQVAFSTGEIDGGDIYGAARVRCVR